MFGLALNLKFLGAIGLAGLIAIGSASWIAYSKGYELAELRGAQKIQAIKDEVAAANALIRQEQARRQREVEALLESRVEEVRRHAERQLEAQQRIAEYERELEGRDACLLDERDLDGLQ